jgi:tetratricopeptide (TPR) repeat protein
MRATVCLAVVLALGCSRGRSDSLTTVPLPDLSGSDASVREQIGELHATALRRQKERAPATATGAAFGELGMALHAGEYLDAAEPAYRNAQALLPDDRRWPYYLGQLFRARGNTEGAITSLQRALDLDPSDVPTLVWLARTYLDQGRPEAADPLLLRAQARAPHNVAVLAAMGQSALARGDHARAVTLLNEALAANPRASSLHSPLASAYRGLGDSAKADSHLAQWRESAIPLDDPLNDQLAVTLRSAVALELRGVKALDAGDWAGAAAFFRQGLELTSAESPVGRSLQHKLGLALYFAGDARAAVQQLEQAVRLSPRAGNDEPASRAHYALGVLRASAGDAAGGIEHLSRAVEFDPTSVAARLTLANALRSSRRDEASLAHYREVVRLDAQSVEARLGYALALVRLRRHVEARAWLEESVQAQPDRPELAHALSRLLAASFDPRVRDHERAYAIVGELFKTSKRTEVGETLAMTFADAGQFEEAASVQRGVLAAAERAGLVDDVRRMRANLRLYERRQPCRTPWPDDDPVHRPGPPVSPQLAAALR